MGFITKCYGHCDPKDNPTWRQPPGISLPIGSRVSGGPLYTQKAIPATECPASLLRQKRVYQRPKPRFSLFVFIINARPDIFTSSSQADIARRPVQCVLDISLELYPKVNWFSTKGLSKIVQ